MKQINEAVKVLLKKPANLMWVMFLFIILTLLVIKFGII